MHELFCFKRWNEKNISQLVCSLEMILKYSVSLTETSTALTFRDLLTFTGWVIYSGKNSWQWRYWNACLLQNLCIAKIMRFFSETLAITQKQCWLPGLKITNKIWLFVFLKCDVRYLLTVWLWTWLFALEIRDASGLVLGLVSLVVSRNETSMFNELTLFIFW